MKRTIQIADGQVSFDDTPEMRELVFEKVLAFFCEHGAFTGEAIMQSDGPQLDGPEFLSDLSEVFNFDVEWSEE